MDIKGVNRFFGYAYFTVGVVKIIFTVLIFIKFFTILSSFGSGADYGDISSYGMFSLVVAVVQIVLGSCSLIMIFVNMRKQPNVIKGYVFGLCALSLEFLMSGILGVFIIIPECYLYMEAGKRITKVSERKDSYFRY